MPLKLKLSLQGWVWVTLVLGKRQQAIKDEQERLRRNSAYQSAYAKADEACKLLRIQQSLVFADDDDDDDLRKSLEKHEEEKGASNLSNDQNSTAGESRENKVVFKEMQEFVWGLHIHQEARKHEDVYVHDDEESNFFIEEKKDEAGGWTQIKETIHEVPVGKGLSGALKLLKDRGTLKENIDSKREIHIERTDEFGRMMTSKEAFSAMSHKFHGKGPGKRKKEKRFKQYNEELKQMKSSDTPSMSGERMRETQARMKTPYLVLSGHVKPGWRS